MTLIPLVAPKRTIKIHRHSRWIFIEAAEDISQRYPVLLFWFLVSMNTVSVFLLSADAARFHKVTALLRGLFFGLRAHVAGTAALERRMLVRQRAVAAVAGPFRLLVMIGLEQALHVPFLAAFDVVAFLACAAGHIGRCGVRRFRMVAEIAFDFLVRGMIEENMHARGSGVFEFYGLLGGLGFLRAGLSRHAAEH